MPCESMRKPNQTLNQRKDEVRQRAKKIDQLIVSGKVKIKVGPQGAITFNGIELADRDGLTDGCIYRMLSGTGSSAAKMAIQKAETLAGRVVDKKLVAQGIHSHDGGATWHPRG